jgi:hypothetical protein
VLYHVSFTLLPVAGGVGAEVFTGPEPPPLTEALIVIVLDVVFVEILMLLPGTIDSVSVADVARINDEFALIVANEFEDDPPLLPLAI